MFLVYTPLFNTVILWSLRIPEDSLVKASADWSDAENAIWQRLNQQIAVQFADDDAWGSLKTHGLVIANTTAE